MDSVDIKREKYIMLKQSFKKNSYAGVTFCIDI